MSAERIGRWLDREIAIPYWLVLWVGAGVVLGWIGALLTLMDWLA